MKAEECKVGLEVRLSYDPSKGIIRTMPDHQSMVVVDWSRQKGVVRAGQHNTKDLIVVDPIADKQRATIIQAKIDEAKNAFEKAFLVLEEVKAFRHDEHGTDFSVYSLEDEGLVSMKELERVIENNGWSSSSLYC
jgi:hypothetical protein